MLDKKDCLFERDEEGKLIGKLITLESIENKPEIKIKPLTRGKLMEIFQKAKEGSNEEKILTDEQVIEDGLIEPNLTAEEIKVLKIITKPTCTLSYIIA